MKSLNRDYYNKAFSHIYVEETVRAHPRTKAVLERFPDAVQIPIHHYKDVFCLKKQDDAVKEKKAAMIQSDN